MTIQIINADCRVAMREIAAESVQCVVTSPPYWGLRDYGLEGVVWDENGACEHEWGDATCGPGGNGDGTTFRRDKAAGQKRGAPTGAFCCKEHCEAWRGCLGLEPTVDLFVEHLVAVFREVRRVLRPDGTVWLNLGDCYNGSPPRVKYSDQADNSVVENNRRWMRPAQDGLKPKDLIMVPHRVALALQADGWWVRSAIVWAKGLSMCPTYAGSVMPESCTDRPTSAYEMVFLLSKQARYFYDADAVREAALMTCGSHGGTVGPKQEACDDRGVRHAASNQPGAIRYHPSTRNLRNVWAINPQAFPDAHFATFPEALVEPCIKAGSSPQACGICGAPFERVVSREETEDSDEQKRRCGADANGEYHGTAQKDYASAGAEDASAVKARILKGMASRATTGWQPTCKCDPQDDTGGSVVLDPFGGSGTVGLVAKRMGRDAILIDASAEYCEMARNRCAKDVTAEMFT